MSLNQDLQRTHGFHTHYQIRNAFLATATNITVQVQAGALCYVKLGGTIQNIKGNISFDPLKSSGT
jgi:hypothetical protein